MFLLAVARLGRRMLVVVLGAGVLLSLGLAEWGARNHPTANFFLLPTRAWELGVGALLAVGWHGRPRPSGRPASIAALLGLTMIGYACVAFDGSVYFPSLWTLLPVGGAALVIVGAGPHNSVGRFLRLRPILGIGLLIPGRADEDSSASPHAQAPRGLNQVAMSDGHCNLVLATAFISGIATWHRSRNMIS